MKNNSVVFFTDNEAGNSKLIGLLETLCNISICSFKSESWTDVDFYSNKNVAFIIDEIPDEKDASWILSKLSEDNIFSNIPILFTSYDSMYEFERMGFVSCACDVLPKPFDYEMTRRRYENIVEIHQLKQQIYNLTQIHTKRILNQANKLKEQNNKIQTMNFDLVELLVAAIESRDLESGQHIKRIRYFTKALTDVVAETCPEYGITSDQAEFIFYGSSVHDIGKIAIPDAIMLKPGRLTREEYDIMKTHTTRGAKLLSMLDGISESQYFQYCKDICLYHHERWDGRGYPKGLKGDATPISAQIVAVADCYDALTSNRPYKSALSHEEAVELITSGACGQFSPQLMKCFAKALPEFARIENELKNVSENDTDYDYTVTDPPHEQLHEEEITYEEATQATPLIDVKPCDVNILSAYDIIFEADIKGDFFEVSRGTWTKLFPYVPKNFSEVIAQCLKICHPADAGRFTHKVNLETFSELIKQGKRKTRVEFRVIRNNEELLVIGFLSFEVTENLEISKIFGAFNVYKEDEIYSDIKQGFAVTDGLTGLLMQKQMNTDVDEFIKSEPDSKDLVIYIDIDDMGMVNNVFGYEYGNLLIKELAAKLRGIKGQDLLICKSISDKFIIFVKNIKKQSEVILFIEKLHNTLRKSYHTPTESGVFTVTMGIARYPHDGKNFRQLLSAAEFASKSAKINGRSAYAFYNNSMKKLAAFSSDYQQSGSELYADSDYEPKFAPVINKKTGSLVCYDYIPFSLFDDSMPVTTEVFYELNKSSSSRKNLSILSIKSLLYMLIGLRNAGEKVPNISVYTLISPEDIPGFVQELKSFTVENDCSGIKLCIILPQDFLESINVRKLRTFSSFITELGFSLGLFLIGDRYIHNNCYVEGIFERFVLTTEFIERSIMTESSISYSAQTINNLKAFVNDVSVPLPVTDAVAAKFFESGCAEFSETLPSLTGMNNMLFDYKKRGQMTVNGKPEKLPAVTELSQNTFFYDINRSSSVVISYDINTDKVGISSNADAIFGFNICEYLNESEIVRLERLVHPGDLPEFISALTKARISLKVTRCFVRFVADSKMTSFRKYQISVICIVDGEGTPIRFQAYISLAD